MDRKRKERSSSAGEDMLNLRVSAEVATAFRVEAARHKMRQNAFFEEVWRVYLEKRDGDE